MKENRSPLWKEFALVVSLCAAAFVGGSIVGTRLGRSIPPDLPAASQSAVSGMSAVEPWLDRIAERESAGDSAAVGKAGERGAYQIQRRTWEHYSRVPWRTGAHNPVESRRVARLILQDCVRACERKQQPVTFDNVYHWYRHGGF